MSIASSELILREDGSVFHLAMRPEQLAEKVILVGDPGRVALIAERFQTIESETSNREFRSMTGSCDGKRITVLSTGIGTDNIDIVMNELDALANIDFSTREVRSSLRSLSIVRLGTCGGMQPDTPVGSFIASAWSIGADGILNYYAGRNWVNDSAMSESFVAHTHWNPAKATPYAVRADEQLTAQIADGDMMLGVTLSAPGFYGPQGRVLRLPLDTPDINERIRSWEYNGMRVLNYEMESSLIAGLARLLGHRATTVCAVIANRYAHNANVQYQDSIRSLADKVLQRI
ncbi:MAG: nucleoside phosphorylase [Paludibacteraceae bacterium]|jgi:uridine phosphorylase|nr:nucleoside phosphorylase [Paludibacteraceae bacterium]